MFNKRSESAPLGSSIGGAAESRHEAPGLKADPGPPDTSRKPDTSRGKESSIFGSSLRIQGDITGDEDLVIQGRLEGSITLKEHIVTVGKNGRASATVNAKSIKVEGTVEGELRGREQIVVTRTGSVDGNLVAPRVTLEDGCRFKGSIDMEGADAGGAGKVTDIMLGASATGESGKANESGKAR